jgi:hypothetical protein
MAGALAANPVPDADAGPEADRGWGWPGRLLAVGVPTVLFGLHALVYGRWIVDDAGITYAYARSLTSGAGPVLQPGADAVEGYSNPAWLALLAAGRWLGLFDRGAWFGVPDYVAFPKLLALLLVAAVFGCCAAIAAALSRHPLPVAVLAGALTAAVPSFVVWTVSGLENALLALAAVAIAALLVRAEAAGRLLAWRTAAGCGLLAALAALTRPDGLVYVAAFPLAALLLHRGRLSRAAAACAVSVGVFAVPVGGYLLWRITTFGQYLPNTAVAKAQGLPGAAALLRPAEILGYVGWPAGLLAVAAIGTAAARPWTGRRGFVALLVPLVLAVAAFGVLEGDWMGQLRFATPVWPLGVLATVLAVARVLPQLSPRFRVAAVVLSVVALLGSGWAALGGAREFRAAPTAPLCLVAQNTGRAFNDYARIVGGPRASLLAPDLGGAALTSELRLIDLAGLADRRIAALWAAGDRTGLRDHVFDRERPTFITSNADWSRETGLLDDPRLRRDYVEIATSRSGVTDFVRRDALGDTPGGGTLAALRGHAARVTGPADAAARRSPRASCGDVLVPGPDPTRPR